MSEETVFHKILNREIPSHAVYEDDHVYAFLDAFPVSPGHVLVIPKHADGQNLYDVAHEPMAKVFEVLHAIAPAVVRAVRADGFVVSMNNGVAAGQTVFYPHMHIIPRFDGDGHKAWEKIDRSPEELAGDAEKIRQEIG